MAQDIDSSKGNDVEFGSSEYMSVAFVAGTIISLQIGVMRVFAVGSWTHFGSLVISLALLGFSLSSVIIFALKSWVERYWKLAATVSLLLTGPLIVASNFAVQQMSFNAIFLVSDPVQKWRLLANFLFDLLPFLSGAFFLGVIFLKSGMGFNRMYSADLAGSGVAGIVMLGALYILAPENVLLVSIAWWAAGLIAWLSGLGAKHVTLAAVALASLTAAAYVFLPTLTNTPAIAVTQYKGISYARNFPDAKRIYHGISPYGDLQVYQSSFMHFAPGLSDNAAFNIPEVPPNIYVGLYLDGDGPEGIMRDLPPQDSAYFDYLPAHYPYVLKKHAKTFVVKLGGGISAKVALQAGSETVTAAEANPAILSALRAPKLKAATSNLLANPRLHIVNEDARIFLAHAHDRYDVIDLSLADSVGLSDPGGFPIEEKYDYTEEAMIEYMKALNSGGVLAVTVWNKEDPAKSILDLYATVAQAAKAFGPNASNSIFVASSYLATTTVLYKEDGFSTDDISKLRNYTSSMSFDEIYSPGFKLNEADEGKLLTDYHASIFGKAPSNAASSMSMNEEVGDSPPIDDANAAAASSLLPSTILARLAWKELLQGNWPLFARRYAFAVHPLTNDRPYFAGYEKIIDLPKTLDRLDLFQDDWGYLVLWATLGVAGFAALPLIGIPLIFGWRSVFSRTPGKAGAIVFFACLGIGYITVEVGLISRFTLVFSNPTISASILISALLVFSGLGSLLSERAFDKARNRLPIVLTLISLILIAYAFALPALFGWIGGLPFAAKTAATFALLAPLGTLMGFPMATGMGWLARLRRESFFVWAWGINGCFSVIGAAFTPIIATTFGLNAVLFSSAAAYALAVPAFLQMLQRDRCSFQQLSPTHS